jgi:hypothetical protein
MSETKTNPDSESYDTWFRKKVQELWMTPALAYRTMP